MRDISGQWQRVLMCCVLTVWLCAVAAAPVLPTHSGADKSLKNADEKTAFEVAELNEQADVMALLK